MYALGAFLGIALLVWIVYDLGIRQRNKNDG